MFVQLVHFEVKPGRIDEFLDVFRVNYDGTTQEPGNFRFDVLQSSEDESRFTMYEIFESEDALEDHRKTDHYKQTVAGLEGLLVRPRYKSFLRLMMPNSTDRSAEMKRTKQNGGGEQE